MKNKKKFQIAGIAGLAALAAVGASLAYFTDQEQALRFVELGHVDIDLTEDMLEDPQNPDSPWIGYQDPDNVWPGDEISKRPVITAAEDSLDCYVRASVTIESPHGLLPELTIDNLNINREEWFVTPDEDRENTWYCYYIGGSQNGILQANDSVFVFDQVKIPGEWEAEAYGQQIIVDVTAEAIQAENFEPAIATDSQGNIISCAWRNTEGQEIVTEVYEAE